MYNIHLQNGDNVSRDMRARLLKHYLFIVNNFIYTKNKYYNCNSQITAITSGHCGAVFVNQLYHVL